jgi:hypothetical protein
LEAIDNEECVFIYNGKRKVLRNGEVSFCLIFSEAIDGNFEAAKLVKVIAEEYFGPQAEGPSHRFVVVPDGCSSPPRRPGSSARRTCYRSLLALYSAGLPDYRSNSTVTE